MSHKWLDNTSARAFRAAKLRYSFIIGAIIALSVTCVGILLYQQDQKNKLTKIANEYSAIDTQYYQENLQGTEAASKSSSVSKPSVDHSKSMAQFSEFALKYAKEPYGWQAGIRAGNYDINQGNIQAAKELFEAIIPYISKFPVLEIKVRTVLAGIYAEQNDGPKAIQQVENIDKIPNNPISDQSKLYHAQILYMFGKSDEARQILSTLNSEQAKIWLSFLEV